jgi:putative iron-regulated protein
MNRSQGTRVVVLAGLLLTASCGNGGSTPPDLTAGAVKQYAAVLDANYKDTISKMEALKATVDAFNAAPSAEGYDTMKKAWLEARIPYGQCEFSRFYGGPLDQAQGAMNEWPIDENYVDYTAGNPKGGIINDVTQYPEITGLVLTSLTGKGGTENLATGFHALEFLIWGQRLDQTAGPGERPYTDYLDGGTAENQDRRRAYLQTATTLLVSDMRAVEAEWHLEDPESYGAGFVAASPVESLTKIYRGFSQMAISEVYYERLSNPYRSKDRKDEESCFSESTLQDLIANAHGLEAVYSGTYGSLKGPSLSDLIRAKDPRLDSDLKGQLAAIRKAIEAIPDPFDHAVLADPASDESLKVQAAIDACKPLTELLDRGATALGIVNNL